VKSVALLLVLGGAVVARPYLQPLLPRLRQAMRVRSTPAMLSIESEPSGATVSVDGTVLGTTPLALDNGYADGNIPVQMTLKGYKPWKGFFAGGEPAALNVKLKR
jgi:serine/threonine-protein kinase